MAPGDEIFVAVFDPLHWTMQQFCRRAHRDVFASGMRLEPEAATDIADSDREARRRVIEDRR